MAQITVHHRFIHQAPRKLRLVTNMVKGQAVQSAIAELDATTKIGAKPIRDLIKSGVAAAKEKGLGVASLSIARISVDEGPKLRRFVPLSRGRSQRISKQMSHLHISLSDETKAARSSGKKQVMTIQSENSSSTETPRQKTETKMKGSK